SRVGSHRLPGGNNDRGGHHSRAGLPFGRRVNDTTASRATNSERLDRRRSSFSRWAPLIFFAFVLIGPIFSPDARTEDWVFAVGVVAVALPTFVVSEMRGWDIAGATVLMLL